MGSPADVIVTLCAAGADTWVPPPAPLVRAAGLSGPAVAGIGVAAAALAAVAVAVAWVAWSRRRAGSKPAVKSAAPVKRSASLAEPESAWPEVRNPSFRHPGAQPLAGLQPQQARRHGPARVSHAPVGAANPAFTSLRGLAVAPAPAGHGPARVSPLRENSGSRLGSPRQATLAAQIATDGASPRPAPAALRQGSGSRLPAERVPRQGSLQQLTASAQPTGSSRHLSAAARSADAPLVRQGSGLRVGLAGTPRQSSLTRLTASDQAHASPRLQPPQALASGGGSLRALNYSQQR